MAIIRLNLSPINVKMTESNINFIISFIFKNKNIIPAKIFFKTNGVKPSLIHILSSLRRAPHSFS